MGTRVLAVGLLVALAQLVAACSGDDSGTSPRQDPTSAADCAQRIPDHVFTILGWTASSKPPKATVRGCHREAEQGYVEVRDRTGDYGKLCSTLDRSGGVAPGLPPDWLTGYIACAVEPAGGVGQTKVLVKGDGDEITQVTVAVLSRTDRAKVRAAVAELVAGSA